MGWQSTSGSGKVPCEEAHGSQQVSRVSCQFCMLNVYSDTTVILHDFESISTFSFTVSASSHL